MKFIKDAAEIFTHHDGVIGTFEDTDAKVDKHDMTVRELMYMLLKIFDDQHGFFVQAGKVLTPSETGSFNQAFKALRHKDNEVDGYLPLETEDFSLLQKVANWTIPVSPWWRSQNLIADILKESEKITHLPDPVEGPATEAQSKLNGSSQKVGAEVT